MRICRIGLSSPVGQRGLAGVKKTPFDLALIFWCDVRHTTNAHHRDGPTGTRWIEEVPPSSICTKRPPSPVSAPVSSATARSLGKSSENLRTNYTLTANLTRRPIPAGSDRCFLANTGITMGSVRTLKTVVFVGSARDVVPPWGGDSRLGDRVLAHVEAVLAQRRTTLAGEEVSGPKRLGSQRAGHRRANMRWGHCTRVDND